MKVREDLSADLARREPSYDGEREGPSELIQFLVRKAAAAGRSKAPLAELQRVPITDTPGLERGSGQNDS
jgi:hypothetical protein